MQGAEELKASNHLQLHAKRINSRAFLNNFPCVLTTRYFQDSSEKAVFKITMSLGPGFCLKLHQNVASLSFEDKNSQN